MIALLSLTFLLFLGFSYSRKGSKFFNWVWLGSWGNHGLFGLLFFFVLFEPVRFLFLLRKHSHPISICWIKVASARLSLQGEISDTDLILLGSACEPRVRILSASVPIWRIPTSS